MRRSFILKGSDTPEVSVQVERRDAIIRELVDSEIDQISGAGRDRPNCESPTIDPTWDQKTGADWTKSCD